MRRMFMTLFISLVSVVMLFASQNMVVSVPGMLNTKTMDVLQTKYCSYCSTEQRKQPLSVKSHTYWKYGVQSQPACSICKGKGVLQAGTPYSRKCEECNGKGKKPLLVTHRWWHCNNCNRDF